MIKWVKSFYTAFLYKKYDVKKSHILQYHNGQGKLKYKVVNFKPTEKFMSLDDWIKMKMELKNGQKSEETNTGKF